MIRRRHADRFCLIAQHEHALLAGQLARHVGNADFAMPLPWEHTIHAAGLHDCGWTLHDQRPTRNAQGLPLHVFETPLSIALPAWTESANQVHEQCDPYSALLVSIHVLSLSAFAATHPHTPREMFDLNRFQHREVERQDRLRKTLGLRTDIPLKFGLACSPPDESERWLAYNLGVLQLCDQLSLCLLCDDVPFPRIQGVRRRPGAEPVDINVRRHDEHRIVVDPWPMNLPRLTLRVSGRSVEARAYAGDEELWSHWASASPTTVEVELAAP